MRTSARSIWTVKTSWNRKLGRDFRAVLQTLKTTNLVLEKLAIALKQIIQQVIAHIPLKPHFSPAHMNPLGLIAPMHSHSLLNCLPPALVSGTELPINSPVLRGIGYPLQREPRRRRARSRGRKPWDRGRSRRVPRLRPSSNRRRCERCLQKERERERGA
jgi:hypothetical protein